MRRSILFLTSASVASLLPGAAFAQTDTTSAPVDATASAQSDQPPPGDSSDLTNASGQATTSGDIVVTGSRVRRDNFNTASPVDIITRDDRVLAGSRSTADVLQSASVTSGTSQVNGSFLGFVSEGGPAANTVGLRGLSSSRTLVLLNGRRLAPAGAGPQLVSADLNVLPTSMVQRIEVLREGASSVYGSDAIAGVVNVITDTKLNGIVLDAFTDQPVQHGGGGRTYRTSLSAGHVFERGHITASVEYRQLDGMRIGDRKKFSCPRDLFFAPGTNTEVGQIDPATGQLMCFPYVTNGGSGTASGYGVANGEFAANRLTYDNGDINSLRIVDGLTRTSFSREQLKSHVISPVRTYTGYVNGGYELGALGDAELYGEALFTRRRSHQDATYQLAIDPAQLDPLIEIYGGTYGGIPIEQFGVGASPFFPNSVANAGYFQFTPFFVPDKQYFSDQKVDFFRANGGLRGNLGIGDWRYDGNLQVSRTKARQNILLINAPNLSNALETVLAPAGTPANLVTRALPGQRGAGNNYTCASNVANGQIVANASCVPLNLYDPNIVIGGHLPDNVFNYLFEENISHTTFRQTTFAFNVDGTLLTLPAGKVRAAVGFEHRADYIKDTPSENAQAATLYNYSSGGITTGKDRVDEVYGEISIPLVKDKPFFYDLQLDASARYTHYRSYGSDVTYHLNAQWAPAEFLRFRANYGTSFRAPNLFEQYIADQTGFYPSSTDPCTSFGLLDPSTTTYRNCLAELTPILGANAINYIATSGPQVTTRGGAGNLKAEHSTSYGLGTVITLPRDVADLSLAIDYWHIRVEDEVAVLGNLILNRCYEAEDFGPGNPYCDLIDPRRPASDPQRGTLSSFLNPYLNVSAQSVSGIDFDLRYARDLFGGKFVAQGKATRTLNQNYKLFADEESFDYNGTLGVQGFGAGPKWVGNFDLRFSTSNDMTFRWGVTYVGPQDSTDLAGQGTAPIVGNVDTDLHAEHYWEHGASIQWRWRNVGQFTMGVNNIFNAHPPVISSFPTSIGQYTRIGNYFNSSNYDLIGRSVFFNATRQF